MYMRIRSVIVMSIVKKNVYLTCKNSLVKTTTIPKAVLIDRTQ